MLFRRFAAAAFVACVLTFLAFGRTALPVEAAGNCAASATAVWKADGMRALRTEAYSSGPTCALAVTTLVVRASDGKVLWAEAAPVEHVMTFVEVKTRKQMARALSEWLLQSHTFKTTSDLPEWKKGAEAPVSGEFPFYPEAGIDRDAYEQIRAEKQPVFCYVQGMESLACLGLSKDGSLAKVGLQLFPG
ncbi:MAG: hypothetical protein K8S25_06750 [Alphaproteobacteria bacterium]|nr:hypothetical protein [Alphaproteobacteria bacterium]